MGCFIINVSNCINRSAYEFLLYKPMAAGDMHMLDVGCMEETDTIFDGLLTRINRSRLASDNMKIVVCVPRSITSSLPVKKSTLYCVIVLYYRLIAQLNEHGITCPVTVMFFDSVRSSKYYESFTHHDSRLLESFTLRQDSAQRIFAPELEGDFENAVESADVAKFYRQARAAAAESAVSLPESERFRSYITACRTIFDEFAINVVRQKLSTLTPAEYTCDMLVMIDYLICLSRPEGVGRYQVSECSEQTLAAHFAQKSGIVDSYLTAVKEYRSRLQSTAANMPAVSARRTVTVSAEPELRAASDLREKFMQICQKCETDLSTESFFGTKGTDSCLAVFLALQNMWRKLYPSLHEDIVRAEEGAQRAAQADSDLVYNTVYEAEHMTGGTHTETYTDGAQKRADLLYARTEAASRLNCSDCINLSREMKEAHDTLDDADRSISYILSYATFWDTKLLLYSTGALMVLFLVLYLCAQSYAVTSWIFYLTLLCGALLLLIGVPVTYYFIRSQIKKHLKLLREQTERYFSLYSNLAAGFEERAKSVCEISAVAGQLRDVDTNLSADAEDNEKIAFHREAIARHLAGAASIIQPLDGSGAPVLGRKIPLNIHIAPEYNEFYAVEPEEGWRQNT